MSDYDLQTIQEHHEQDMFEVTSSLSEEYQEVVYKTLETGQLVEPPPMQPPAVKAKKTRAKKRKVADEDEDSEVEAPKPKRSRKKHVLEEFIESEDESMLIPASQKTRSRQPVAEPEETEAIKNIRSLTEKMREAAAK